MYSRLRLLLSVLFITAFISLNAQSVKLSGKVMNEKNEPLAGANIIITNGASKQAISDVEGKFYFTFEAGEYARATAQAICQLSETAGNPTPANANLEMPVMSIPVPITTNARRTCACPESQLKMTPRKGPKKPINQGLAVG